jgi:hypothetical protein
LCLGDENGFISFFIGVKAVNDVIKARRLYNIFYNSLGNARKPSVSIGFLYNIKEVMTLGFMDVHK